MLDSQNPWLLKLNNDNAGVAIAPGDSDRQLVRILPAALRSTHSM